MTWLFKQDKKRTCRPPLWGRYVFCLFFLSMAAGHSRQEPNVDMPPNLPLKRTTPHIYTFTNTIQIPVNQEFPILIGAGTPILWPLIPTSNWNRVDIDNINVRLQTGHGVQTDEHAGHMAVKSNLPGEWAISIPTPDRITTSMELRIRMDIKSYSSELDENAAAKIPWFENWREDIAVYLAPSDFINSNQQQFKQAVTDVLGQNPKQYSPHIAAKLLIRYCLEKIESNGEYSDLYGKTTRGFNVNGALPAASTGKGTACDLLCVCIATLRAAGIPARPVIGITNYDPTGLKKVGAHYIVWGEYALPNSGWVPFNPKRMQGTIDNVPVDTAMARTWHDATTSYTSSDCIFICRWWRRQGLRCNWSLGLDSDLPK